MSIHTDAITKGMPEVGPRSETKRVLDEIVDGPLTEPASEVPEGAVANDAGSTPLSLRESHARLILTASKLGESVKAAKARSDEGLALYRKLRAELDETTRALKALDRIAHPKRKS